jgi:hypothetical protein
VYQVIQQKLDGERGVLRYARVNMSLAEMLSGDFFNHYIKSGRCISAIQELGVLLVLTDF